MSDFARAADRFRRAATVMREPSRQALTAAGVAAKQAVHRQAQADLGADMALSRFGRGRRRGRVPARARFDVTGRSEVTVKPAVPGVWALLQFGSKTRWRYPRRPGRPRRPGTYSRTPVSPRRTWSRSLQAQQSAAVTAFHRVAWRDVERIWR